MNLSIKDFFGKCDQIHPQFPADMVAFTVEIRNGKLHFLCSNIQRILLVNLIQTVIPQTLKMLINHYNHQISYLELCL